MRVLQDFECQKCGILHKDNFVDNDTLTIECRMCQGTAAKKQYATRFVLPGNGRGFPTADDKWVKHREQKMAQERADNS